MITFNINDIIFSIYPTHDSGSLQIPIGNNTGSLPDLTSVHFPAPLLTTLDQETADHSSSPYSSVMFFFLYNYNYVIPGFTNIF